MSLRSDLDACLRSYDTTATAEDSRLAESSLVRLRAAADTANVIGANEDASEISPRSLPFLLVDYMLALVYDEFKGIHSGVERARVIGSAQRFALSFLTRIVDADVPLQEAALKKRVRDIVNGDGDDGGNTHQTDARALREMKIATFRRERELKQRIAEVERERGAGTADTDDRDDDENARTYWMTRIELAVMRTVSMLQSLKTETDIIREHESAATATATTPANSNGAANTDGESQAKPIETFTIRSSADFNSIPDAFARHVVRTTDIERIIAAQTNVRDRVFRNPNPATMTVEQWADQQIALGNLPTAATTTSQVAPRHGDDDDEVDEDQDSDTARVKQREWDDWADDHEKGAGNRKTR